MNHLVTVILQAEAKGPSSMIGTFLPLVLIVVVFYFFMIRPQMKRQKEAKIFREGLKKGDSVMTSGGIYGKISEVGDTWVNLEIANNVTIKVDKTGLIADPSAKN